MNRRSFLHNTLGALGFLAISSVLPWRKVLAANTEMANSPVAKINKNDAEWQKILTSEQYNVLREDGTERPFTSPLNHEKHNGIFACAACHLALFSSDTKFDSGTGWPSFYAPIKGHIETKTDMKMFTARTEYHCARCGGHQGHVFDDGPPPTGLRHCNNGVALTFIPDKA